MLLSEDQTWDPKEGKQHHFIIPFYHIANMENRNINLTQIHRKGHALTEAVPCCAECAANLATWFIIGEKLVGP